MTKHKAIPEGYISVGELAKKMNTTVRALQYYDKEGLLSPSGISEGGRRLYTDKDIVTLHQILSMKSLGFTLADIKGRLLSLETPEDVAEALGNQASVVREKIASLSDTLDTIEKLREETLAMQTVDFKRYADIVVNLQMKNEFYGLVKHFDEKTLAHFHLQFNIESGTAVVNTLSRLMNEIEELQKHAVSPDSEQGLAIAKQWWDMVTAFTGGDMSLLPGLMEMAAIAQTGNEDWNKRWTIVESFLQKALEAYFTNLGYDPFGGQQNDSNA